MFDGFWYVRLWLTRTQMKLGLTTTTSLTIYSLNAQIGHNAGKENQSIASNAHSMWNTFSLTKTLFSYFISSIFLFSRLRSLRNYCELFVKILVTRRFDTVFLFSCIYIFCSRLCSKEEKKIARIDIFHQICRTTKDNVHSIFTPKNYKNT